MLEVERAPVVGGTSRVVSATEESVFQGRLAWGWRAHFLIRRTRT